MLRWGILGTGAIARSFARNLPESRTGQLVAVGSRFAEKASSFGAEFDAPRRHASYEALLADPEVQAVYIATPHPLHARWATLAAEAGKHVLCEKPLTMNLAEATVAVEAARANGVFLMEAFMYRCHPQTARLVELLEKRAVGDVQVIEAVHSFKGRADPSSRLLSNALGGGGILDVGCYCMSGARLVAGVALGTGVAEPLEITGVARVGETGVDESAIASLKFDGGILAQLSCSVRVNQPPLLRVHGSEGTITLREPWLPTARGEAGIEVRTRDGLERIEIASDRGLYAYEADVVAGCVERRLLQPDLPAPSWDDSLGNMRALDRWRRAVRVVHESDGERGLAWPVRGALRERATIPHGRVEGLDKPVSRLVSGTILADSKESLARAVVLFDDYFERGGNCFDTAYIYGRGGSTESALGFWHSSREVRDQIVIIAKGAHTPHCDPAAVGPQLAESLERLRTDYADLYFLHRDREDVPVSEFVDALNAEHRAGRIKAFGGSNWTTQRVDEANSYAASKGLAGFTALSNQFSLARMLVPTYVGCLGANDPITREWLARTGTPNFAWSSQASGFFSGLRPGGFLSHAWFDDDNLERRRRAEELAARLGVEPVAVALAWLLALPLEIYPLIGPVTPTELATSWAALDIHLTGEQVRWLELDE